MLPLSQFSAEFLQRGGAPRHFCCTPDFGVVAASGAEGCHWNVDQVSPSLIGQWISPCFSMDAINTALGATMWTSLECAASQQHYGTSPVFIRRIVFEIELFFVFPSSITCNIIEYDADEGLVVFSC